MRLGGPLFTACDTPAAWVQELARKGYRAAYAPLGPDSAPEIRKAYAAAAQAADVVIAEVGAWSNPLSPDDATRAAAVANCKRCLALADDLGARCCVNIAGSLGAKWDGPCRDDLTDVCFDKVVTVVREIIDSVQPRRSCYALETMPWMVPDSVDSYLRLIRAVDRKAFGVHFDPVNLVCSPQRYFRNGDLIRDFIARLGPYIRSCHAKDILLLPNLTVHLDEVRPGCGALDYPAFLRGIAALAGDIPVMLEHLPSVDEYDLAATHLRRVAAIEGLSL